jgi:hypothetical protein
LEPYGGVKTLVLLIPWHVHEQNLNGKKHDALSYIYIYIYNFSFQDGYIKLKKITMHSWFIDTFDE